ncbi:MAG: polysaccharide deacetylase family protein, partial [Actinobacteria bacterium]|nr:polysaccharide deacetylase family protein [Actinomycetota bacterium]
MTQRFSDGARGYGLGLVCLPIAALPTAATLRDLVTVAVAVAVASVIAAVFARVAATRRNLWLGPLLVALASLLYSVTPAGVSTAIIAVLVGAGAGLSTGGGRRPLLGPAQLAGAVLSTVAVLGSWWSAGRGSSVPFLVAAVSSVLAATVLAASLPQHLPGTADGDASAVAARRGSTTRRILVGSALSFGALMVVWTGCNDPRLSWFGPVDAHGPRDERQVAITFDDGPNDTASLEVARILDERGVKGTFFEVGRAVRTLPGVARQLVADGH